ncbi:MAG TPA: class I SAM-dependent rRNA methyltransferase [Gemmataceae bacterium]|jgi:23S rRNA (cytosine1962-C5)-methyltransferase
MPTPRVILKPRRAQPFYGRHPWVFAGAIAAVEGDPADGVEVDLVSHAGTWVARGLYNGRSKIRVRLYAWQRDRSLDREFFRDRLAAAVRLRRDILGLHRPGGACRLVFSEGDGLSGLTVDKYDRWLAVQFTSLGLAHRRDEFAELLMDLTGAAGVYLRTERGIGRMEGVELHDGPLRGEPPPVPITVEEADGLRYLVNLAEGQKTGFYLDQRDNRRAAARYADGRAVLDAFCYTGGFGLHAARAGAASVDCVDSSSPALQLARQNADLNGLAGVRFIQADVFDRLAELVGEGRRFGMIVLDPPKFARSRGAVPEALRGYRRLQTLALRLLDPDGVLVTCCCTGLITMDMLDELLAQVGSEERRDVQILERHGQAADHPVAVSCMETNYLKCLIARVI